MEELTRAVFFKFHCEKKGGGGVHHRKLGHKIWKSYTSDNVRYCWDLTTYVWRTVTHTQCDTWRASICDDMTSLQMHCSYHRVLENLTHHQPVQKFPSFYETRRFVIVFTTFEHFSLSWARWAKLTLSYPISLRFISTLFSHTSLGLPNGLFSAQYVCTDILSHACHNPHPSQISRIYTPNISWVRIVVGLLIL